MPLPIEHTVRYKTFFKIALVEALQSAFEQHPDPILRDTKVRLDFSFEEIDYPAVLVRFFERTYSNAGVGHEEWIHAEDGLSATKFYRRIYKGDVELAVYALSSLDRDLIADSLVQILAWPDLLEWTNLFALRLYSPEHWSTLTGQPITGDFHDFHYITLGSDEISGFGEAQVPAPWMPEDVLLYQTTYRAPILGEVISSPTATSWQIVQKVVAYPYLPDEPAPQGADDPAEWEPEEVEEGWELPPEVHTVT